VPGEVEELFLKTGTHNISVNWKKPILNANYITHYVIEWFNFPSRNKDSSTVSGDKEYFLIEDLEACGYYKVSVTAVNEKGESSDAVTDIKITGIDGKYKTLCCSDLDAVWNKG
jgi:hypothetical protein